MLRTLNLRSTLSTNCYVYNSIVGIRYSAVQRISGAYSSSLTEPFCPLVFTSPSLVPAVLGLGTPATLLDSSLNSESLKQLPTHSKSLDQCLSPPPHCLLAPGPGNTSSTSERHFPKPGKQKVMLPCCQTPERKVFTLTIHRTRQRVCTKDAAPPPPPPQWRRVSTSQHPMVDIFF